MSASAIADLPTHTPKKPVSPVLFALLLFLVAFLGALVLVAGNGKLPLAFATPAIIALVYAVAKLPLKATALAVIFLMYISDYLPEGPQSGMWASPFYPIGQFLFLNMSALTGVAALRFPGLDFTMLVLCGVALLRRFTRSKIDERTGSVRTLSFLMILMIVTVVALDIWGVNSESPVINGDGVAIALPRPGEFNESLWQLRQLLLMPMFTFLLLYAFPCKPDDLRTIAKTLVVASVIKALVGIFFLYYFVRGSGFPVEFTTSHSDTLLFVPLLGMAFAQMMEKKTKKTYRDLLKWVPIMTFGMVCNDRRIAYVSLGAALFTILMMYPWNSAKRTLVRNLLIASPAILIYIVVGWGAPPDSKVFFGSQLVKSIIKGDQAQAGADYRDIENFDVLYTWSENDILPLGFGHKFMEPVKLPDISVAMPTYQFHPHNNILWMWTIGGWFGFFGLFAPIVAGVFLAARVFRYTKEPVERVAAMTAITMFIAYLNQCFGDMGTRTYFSSMGCAIALAVMSKLAVRSGAWRTSDQATQ